MKRSKEDAAVTREQLLDAAYHLFSTKGYENTTLSDIASEAGLTRGAVYWHFQDKQDLLNQLVIQIMNELKTYQTLTVPSPDTPLLESLLGFVKYPAEVQEKAFFINRLYWLLNTQPEYESFTDDVRSHKRLLYRRALHLIQLMEQDPCYELLGDPETIARTIFMLFESTYPVNSYQAVGHPLTYDDFKKSILLFIREIPADGK